MSSLAYALLVVLCLGRTMAYVERILENDGVCSLNFITSTVNLSGREDQSAMVIRDNQYFQKWSSKHEFSCRFTVTSSLGLGIFAVIQHLSFRRNAQGQCIDYIQFRHAEKTISLLDLNIKFKSSESWSEKMCGKFNAFEANVDSESYQGSDGNDDKEIKNSFIDHKGMIEVKIFLGNKTVESNEELKFEIVFTAFQECKYDNGHWKYCGRKTCIFKDFFNDGKLNCPYKSCKDENGCRQDIAVLNSNYMSTTTLGTKVVAATVACLVTMILVFIAFLWIFRHCGPVFCCMGNPNSHPHSSEMQPVPRLDTMGVVATAPPDFMVASGTEVRTADKDLPPSYESLFPSK
ncbi:Syndecan [Aphis craccivora]|uniref:Syndecan n=1 Tax=Aphis craccivora TaxID=307492 RepID=A0A6G0ZLB8_APHCR|nr:Syndecan [Aphis craccivora]